MGGTGDFMPILQPDLTESQKLNLNVISLNTRVNEQQTMLDEHDKLLVRGNGERSIKDRLRSVEEYIDATKESIKYWGRFVGGALLLNFLGFTAGILLAVFRFLPLLEQLAKNGTP